MGKRTGEPRGPKPGFDKERARQQLRELVLKHSEDMVLAQIANASGIKYLVAREVKTGKFVDVSETQAQAILKGESDTLEMLEVWEKQPNVQAFTDLMNRTLGKPAEHVELEANVNLSMSLESRINAGRDRLAKAKPNAARPR